MSMQKHKFPFKQRMHYVISIASITAALVLLITCISFSQVSEDSHNATTRDAAAYISGEGESEELEEARQLAEAALLRRIQVSITSGSTGRKAETISPDKSSVTDEFIREHRSFSSLNFKGLHYDESKILSVWRVRAYIHRDSLAKSFELRKTKIRDFVNAAMTAAEQGRLNETLRNLYWGYLLSKTYLDTIQLRITVSSLSNNPQTALMNLLKRTFDNVIVQADDCFMDGEEIIAPLKFAYLERPVAALDFSYYSGPGRQHSRIMNYRSDTPIYDKPVYSTYNLTIMIEYIYANEMVNDPEIAELYKIFRECVFNNCKTIMLHIPWNDTTEAPPPPPPLPPAPLDKVTTEPCQFAEVLDVLCKCSNWHDFWDVLNQYRELGLLTYGRRSDFGDGTECYVAVVDKRKVIDILYYDGEMFKVVGSDVRYSDLREKYRGMTQVWIRGRR